MQINFDAYKGPNGLFAKNVEVKTNMEIGSWIDYADKIIEITQITETDIIGKEVLHMAGFNDLRYGETLIISRSLIEPIKDPA